MPKGEMKEERGRFYSWYHRTFDDLVFRAIIGPAQIEHAIQGCDQESREQWKRDLEARKRYSREQRELRQLGRLVDDA